VGTRGPLERHNGEVTFPSAPATGFGYRAKEFHAASALKYVGGFFALGLGISGLYAAAGIGAPCPFRTITGWDCPLCGGTRMGAALMHGDIGAAFVFNPLAFIGLGVITVLAGLWIVEALGGPKVRPPHRIADRLVRIHPTTWLVIGLVVSAAYVVLRNLASPLR
jgi:hypothetical protein